MKKIANIQNLAIVFFCIFVATLIILIVPPNIVTHHCVPSGPQLSILTTVDASSYCDTGEAQLRPWLYDYNSTVLMVSAFILMPTSLILLFRRIKNRNHNKNSCNKKHSAGWRKPFKSKTISK
jgi:uncharacterized membrane protein